MKILAPELAGMQFDFQTPAPSVRLNPCPCKGIALGSRERQSDMARQWRSYDSFVLQPFHRGAAAGDLSAT